MEKSKLHRAKFIVKDDYNTPQDAWECIMSYIAKDTKIWCPFYNDGECKTILNNMGYNDVYHENRDFWEYDLNDRVIIDNPPYNYKKQIIKLLFSKKKPFMLLLPLPCLGYQYILKEHTDKLQVIIPPNRYQMIKGLKGGAPQHICWFCWNCQDILGTNDNMIFSKNK